MDRDLSPFSGEDKDANRRTGRDSLVTVTLFQRPNKSFFMRLSLRSDVRPNVLTRYEIDLDKASSEAEFLRAVEIAGGAAAEHQCQMYGDRHDPDDCAKAAREAAAEILHSGQIKPA